MKNLMKTALLAVSVVAMISCGGDSNDNLELNISGLEDLGSGYVYEGWLIVDGNPITSGTFTVDQGGTLSKTSFEVDADDLEAASTFVLTIEPSPDPDPAPSDVHILAGDFGSERATLTVGHGAALASDFDDAAGSYILATPTDSDMTNETSGVWFLDPMAGPGAGLDLPTLPAGWAYEGWAVIDGTPVSTGTFTSVTGADDAAPFSGANAGPPFPGEDFLQSAPAGLSFPTDLRGAAIVISVEPVPDNSPSPFTLKPLLHTVPSGAMVHSSLTMGNNAANTNPTGSASR